MPRSLRGTLAASIGLLLVLATVAVAAIWYDRAHRDVLLPGVTVGDLAAGGRPASAVVEELDRRLPPVGASALRIVAGDHDDTVTLAELGLRSDATETLARVRAETDGMSLATRVWHRVLNKPLDRRYDVRFGVERAAVQRRVTELAARVGRAPVDARIDTTSGLVTIIPAVEGRSLDVAVTTDRVLEAAGRLANGAGGGTEILAPVTSSAPATTGFADVILVRLAENRLYHYEHGSLVKSYPVATGTPRYPTPKGSFSVVLKRRNPTWVNPDPGGWGRSLPARIGPGPRNPLGTRAMNLDAPGIRIHGTSNVASLGRAASHGCIRMAMADVEELFDRVEQGTPVIVITGPSPAPGSEAAGGSLPVSTLGAPDAPVDLEAG